MKERIQKHYPIITLLLLAATLLFANLGNQYLWQDEAQTCLISKTILERGIPYGTDGVNFFSQELGAEYGENHIWKWHTWLPFYIQAFFFWLFGTSNFVARLPFVLFALGAVYYTYLLARKLFKNETALITIVLLVLNAGFLILSRQARLYSPSIFFSTASLYYFLFILDRKPKSTLWFIVCTTGLFHTHYFYYATFFISVGVYTIIYERDHIKQLIKPVLISGIINLPWIFWFRDLKYNDQYAFNLTYDSISGFFWSYASSAKEHILGGSSFYVVFLFCLITIFYFRKKITVLWKPLFLVMIFIGIHMLFLSAFTPGPKFRYLSVLIPFGIMMLAYMMHFSRLWHRYLPIVLIAFMAYFSPLQRYLYEITHDYDGPLEGICEYLNKHAKPTDTVMITYGDLPVKWYTHLRTYGGLTGEDISNVKNPDWVIDRKYAVCDKDQKIKNFIQQEIDLRRYQKVVIPYPDYMFENREQVDRRIFYPVEEDYVILYKKYENEDPYEDAYSHVNSRESEMMAEEIDRSVIEL